MPWVQASVAWVSSIDAIDTITFGCGEPTGAIHPRGHLRQQELHFLMKFGELLGLRLHWMLTRKIVTEYWTPWISVDDVDEYVRIRKINMLLGRA
jgi:hypothetical protein